MFQKFLRTVGGQAHPREILRALVLTHQVEKDGSHAAFAVVLVGLDPGIMVAVRNRALADVKPQQFGAAFDGLANLRVLHARGARHHQRGGERHAWRVHHAVADEASVRPGELVPPRADNALAIRGFQRKPAQARHHRFVTGGQFVFGQQHDDIAVIPSGHRFVGIPRCPLRFPFHQREIGGIAAGEQCQRVERTGDRTLPPRVAGLLHPLGKRLAAVPQDARGLGALEWRGGAVGSEHRQLDRNFFRFPCAPSGERQPAAAGIGFRRRQRQAEFGARVISKRLASDAKDHVARGEHAVGRRSLVHLRDENLAGVGGDQLVAVDPTARAGGAEVPIVFRSLRNGFPLGEIGIGHVFDGRRPNGWAGRQDGQGHDGKCRDETQVVIHGRWWVGGCGGKP